MNISELMNSVRQRSKIDNEMLKSMSASLRSGLPFSFNAEDMADLLDRLREEHVAHLVGDGS